MKKISILIAVVLVLSLSLLTAMPATAEEPATLLSSTGDVGNSNADTIIVDVPAETTLGDIESIAWSEYLIQGYPPHVDIMLDLNDDGTADEALVFEYAFNGSINDISPTYGALTGEWFQTFGDSGSGATVIDDGATAWLATGLCGETIGTLAEWKTGNVGGSVDSNAIVLRMEIEVDNYMVDCVALVNNIETVIDTTHGVGVTVNIPTLVAISVDTLNIDFGTMYPGGDPSAVETVTVTNIGTVTVDVSASVSQETGTVFLNNLTLDTEPWNTWAGLATLTPTNGAEVAVQLSIPAGYVPAGSESATLFFEVTATVTP